MDLRQHYLKYLIAINSGCKPGALDPFVHKGVIHNDSGPMSIAKYATNVTDAQAYFQGLDFKIEKLVVDPDKDEGDQGTGNIAVRLILTFNPTPGEDESFHEHCFYRFEGGKIRQVWSMLDGAGLEWSKKRANIG